MSDTPSTLAVLFPGQGSQEKGMGRDLAEANSQAMELWTLAEKASGLPLREIYWEGDDAAMADTRALQPAMTVVNLNLWFELRPRLTPMGMAGHSLGEYAALAAAGALPVPQTLELVSLRGRLMAECGGTGGAMAAVLRMSLADIEAVVAKAGAETGKVLLVANYNSPGQYVISGEKAAVDRAGALCKEFKGRAMPLPVSGAFHSPLMAEAAAELAKALAKADFSDPKIPVCQNASGQLVKDFREVREQLTRQMTSSVRWIDTMANLYQAGARTFLELGPKGVLSKMVKPNLEGKTDYNAINVATYEAAKTLAI